MIISEAVEMLGFSQHLVYQHQSYHFDCQHYHFHCQHYNDLQLFGLDIYRFKDNISWIYMYFKQICINLTLTLVTFWRSEYKKKHILDIHPLTMLFIHSSFVIKFISYCDYCILLQSCSLQLLIEQFKL